MPYHNVCFEHTRSSVEMQHAKGIEHMRSKFTVRTIVITILLTFITACYNNESPAQAGEILPSERPGSTQAAPEPTVATKALPGPESTGTGLCANAYFPVRAGATWTYSSTGGPAGGYGFTDTITAVREDGFTLTSQFDELTRTQEWSCTAKGLVALQLGGTSAATLNNDDIQVTLDVANVSCITIPNEISPGDTWQHAIEFTGTIAAAGQEIDASGNVQSSFQAVGVESVTVPAGTFDALKIHIDTIININGSFGGVSFPVNVTAP